MRVISCYKPIDVYCCADTSVFNNLQHSTRSCLDSYQMPNAPVIVVVITYPFGLAAFTAVRNACRSVRGITTIKQSMDAILN